MVPETTHPVDIVFRGVPIDPSRAPPSGPCRHCRRPPRRAMPDDPAGLPAGCTFEAGRRPVAPVPDWPVPAPPGADRRPQDRVRGDPGRLAAHHLLSAGRSGARHADVDPVAVDRHDLLATGTHTLRRAGAGLSASPRRPGPDPGHRGPTPEARTWLSVLGPAARRPSLATAENREPRLASFAVGARDFR